MKSKKVFERIMFRYFSQLYGFVNPSLKEVQGNIEIVGHWNVTKDNLT